MRDQIAAKLHELLSKLDDYEQARFSEDANLTHEYFVVANNDSMLPFHALTIASFIRCSAKNLTDAELDSLCDRIKTRAEQIQQLEDESDEMFEIEKELMYWEDKKFLSATDIGILLDVSSSGIKTNKILENIGLQERVNGGWVATLKAEGMAFQCGQDKGQKPYIKWDKSIIPYLTEVLQ